MLNEYTGKFDENFIPPVKKGAKEFLKKLSDDYVIKLFTTRNKLLAPSGFLIIKLIVLSRMSQT